MATIKINVDPNVFSENTNGNFKLKLVSDSQIPNGLQFENGVLNAIKGADGEGTESAVAGTAGNKVGNGIAGEAYENCNGPLTCHSSVSRRRKAPSTNTIALNNEGVYIPDIIRHLNSNYGDD